MPKLRDLRCLRVRAFERQVIPDGGGTAWNLVQGWTFYGRSRDEVRRRLARHRAVDPVLREAMANSPAIRARAEGVC